MLQNIYLQAKEKALQYFNGAGIILTPRERENIIVRDFSLGMLEKVGVQLVMYVDTKRVSSKDVVLYPGQTCPEHRHPHIGKEPGKEETFRCRWGRLYMYVEGTSTASPKARVPEELKKYFTVWHEVVLNPGDQYTVMPDTLHWFQGGPEGAIVSEFSTAGTDEYDIFTQPGLVNNK